ncbi:DoxX family protein [Nafulsella turpanensis]|uniref:DoxX family protein n=1 Tax=Nafulsella turpanensis TaxID=1265690 RepID=UPI00034B27D3|nr:DoxX family protein [Nafulsella turpanensis]
MKKTLLTWRPLSFDLGLLLLRLVAGAAMLTHGYPKLQRLLSGNFEFGDPVGLGPEISLILAVFAELICSVLIIVGVLTRLATIPLIITMAIAFFVVHGADAFSSRELAFLYLGAYLTIFFTGPGKFSADKTLF